MTAQMTYYCTTAGGAGSRSSSIRTKLAEDVVLGLPCDVIFLLKSVTETEVSSGLCLT